MMRVPYLDLVVVALLAALCLLAALLPAVPPLVQQVLGILLVLFLPGCALVTAILRGPSFGVPERLAVSIGLSIALVIVGGVALNWTPWALQATTWRIVLAGVTLAAVVAAAWRRWHAPAAGRRLTQPARLATRDVVLIAMALLTLGLTVGVARTGLVQAPSDPFTQFWAEPGSSLQIGVQNMEGRSEEYRVRVLAGTQVLAEWPHLSVDAGQEWVANVSLPPVTGQTAIDAQLYRAEAPDQLYRSVRIAPQAQKQP